MIKVYMNCYAADLDDRLVYARIKMANNSLCVVIIIKMYLTQTKSPLRLLSVLDW